ncbi:thylakoid lumenal 17.9 kDa protein, chloroplastic [Canna indica]|uniref:Thylakoid lumenal 17.9 kDa protein, chloroplastic n=1 Tax=Canna indica TaxID=4628 RepID=A0AAQ3JXZ6_9LILI|nr:thylakoid lumenal 17.9 kDa protein, chloroplastic [Canna indica]
MEVSQTTLRCSPIPTVSKPQSPTPTPLTPQSKPFLLSSLAPLVLAVTLSSPLPSRAVPFPQSLAPPFPSSTPYMQSQKLQLGLENGKIRPCPSTNPGCISTNPNSSSFAFPWMIPDNYSENVIQNLRDAILKTQKNVKFKVDEETPNGHYLQAEVDGGFERDFMEFLVKTDVVTFRSMATKVTYIYPFTTAVGDSKGQVKRVNRIREELGWYAPSFESMGESD